MAENSNAPLIVKKVKKAAHGAHHGGSWKVAYADFVTAMMAFFLLLWLLNATTEKQKKGLAEYFSPVVGTVGDVSGGDGFFQGNSVTAQGKLVTNTAPQTISVPIPTTSVTEKSDEGDSSRLAKADNPQDTTADSTSDADTNSGTKAGQDQDVAASDSANAKSPVNEQQAAKVMADVEDKQFNQAEHLLRQAIQDVPQLKELAQNLIIDKTPEGLRIQIVDQDKYAMFPRGGTVMNDKAKLLMQKVAEIVKKMPEKIAITGHTDSTPYVNSGGYDNWDLSTDRANASRRALIEAGLPPERIATMTGRADKEPLDKNDPASPTNRRISIVLLRGTGHGGAAPAAAPGPDASQQSGAAAPADPPPPAATQPTGTQPTGTQPAGTQPPVQAQPSAPSNPWANPQNSGAAGGKRSDATPAGPGGVVYLEPASGPGANERLNGGPNGSPNGPNGVPGDAPRGASISGASTSAASISGASTPAGATSGAATPATPSPAINGIVVLEPAAKN